MRPRVLVVEDSVTERIALTTALEAEGFTPCIAETGAQARQWLAREPFDVIVLDVSLPDDDGILILEAIRESGPTSSTPVLLLSSEDEVRSGIRGVVTEADSYVAKPYDVVDVVTRARELLTHSPAAPEPRSDRRTRENLDTLDAAIGHHLRGPLRSIDGSTRALLEDYGDRLDERAQRYVDRVRSATRRMSELIDDVDELSRLARAEVTIAPVDLADLVREAFAEASRGAPDRTVTLVAPDSLGVDADPHLMRVLAVHLVRSALKLTEHSANTTIELGALVRDGAATYFLSYDGGGYLRDVAIGLALVWRIVDRHGGRAWAESVAGAGTVISFTVGDAPSAAQARGKRRTHDDDEEHRDGD
jgi:signal transduction histidine kinase